VDSRLWIKGELTQDLKRAGAPATYPVDRFDEKGLHIAPVAIEAVSSDGSAVHTRTFRPAARPSATDRSTPSSTRQT
jgi:hypothetical protein